jgi:hypothetical protein
VFPYRDGSQTPAVKPEAGSSDPWHMNGSYRLVTRSDFDGLVCAALLK